VRLAAGGRAARIDSRGVTLENPPAPNILIAGLARHSPVVAIVTSPEVYLANRELIEDAIAALCRRRRLVPDEAEEFAADARLHLIKNDYAVLRAFAGRSSFRTYVIAVLSHLFLDWRNARWGKWRPSAEAKRLGPVAVRLETLTARDRLSFEEACETLRSNYGVTNTRAELDAMAIRFPQRTRRTFTTDDGLESVASPDGAADDAVVQAEAASAASSARRALSSLMSELPDQDRLILQMRYTDGCRVQDIARLLDLDPKPLYRRLERTLQELRRGLESRGITAADALEAISHEGFLADPGTSPESPAAPRESRGEVRPFRREAPSPVSEGRRP
jgi:RNA polymerase sigma factor (sigma-70 family)